MMNGRDSQRAMSEQESRTLLMVVNCPDFFLSHRFPVALAAKAAGYDVHIATAHAPSVQTIREAGLMHHRVDFVRSGQNPIAELKAVLQLFRLLRQLKPDVTHLVTIKPVLYGGLVARVSGAGKVVSAISGLGTVFSADSVVTRLRRWFVTRLYALALHQKCLTVIFQNPDDRNTLLASGALHIGDTQIIRGSGVDLSDYPYCAEPEGKPVVAMAARLLRDKGVFEFVGAARLLKERGVDVEMRLIGSSDPDNPTSVTATDLNQWKQEGVVTLLGYRSDIAHQYAAANIVCLPSYYGEGLPKTLVEAAACGRAVITTNHPGCRDAIRVGETGMLVPVKDEVALADAIQELIASPATRQRMGAAGRALAEEVFDINKIIDQHLRIYREVSDRNQRV